MDIESDILLEVKLLPYDPVYPRAGRSVKISYISGREFSLFKNMARHVVHEIPVELIIKFCKIDSPLKCT